MGRFLEHGDVGAVLAGGKRGAERGVAGSDDDHVRCVGHDTSSLDEAADEAPLAPLRPLSLFSDFWPRNRGTMAAISTSRASRTTLTPTAAFSAATRTPRCPAHQGEHDGGRGGGGGEEQGGAEALDHGDAAVGWDAVVGGEAGGD